MEKSPKLIKEKAFLYSLWSGRLAVYEGDVYRSWRDDGCFVTRTKRLGCATIPKVVYNSVVWLETNDEQLARKILIEYEVKQISLLQEKIANHQYKIFILNNQPSQE